MLDLTRNHIQKLNDEDLRSLVGRLCEETVRAAGISTSAVTWGGKHTAPDGGVDVRINIPSGDIDRYIPRPNTVFQVKEHDLIPSEVAKEMCSEGKLRSSIIELSQQDGAYIIASGNADLSDTMLKARIAAMDDAVKKELSEHCLVLDYYDSERIAAWVRNYPSLIVWVRDRIGEQITGWTPYGNWANPHEDLEAAYVADEKVRLYYNGVPENNIIDGLNRMREMLRVPKTSVRLTGLSGVGKTRFVQALFDERIGSNALNQNAVIYTDTGCDPSPTPPIFAEGIIAKKEFALLVVDNCASKEHTRLVEICERPESCISLLTIEYDITDEQTSETKAFRLESASDELIIKLVRTRFPNIDFDNATKIAQFSGGNARMAIALAKTVVHGESLLALKDSELFKRLFWQRGQEDDSLLRIAEACALVYSFDSDVNDNPENEIGILASLVQMSTVEFYRNTSKLLQREVMQKRNKWRAVLPHAIANKLAKEALRNIPNNSIVTAFSGEMRQRLMLSFARRLSYLHNSEEARALAEGFLSGAGVLANICGLDLDGVKMLAYIAATVPDKVLEKYQTVDVSELETPFRGVFLHEHMRIVANLAYDKDNFNSCVTILVNCVIHKQKRILDMILKVS